jgi:hypothetical protein
MHLHKKFFSLNGRVAGEFAQQAAALMAMTKHAV